MRDAPTVLIVDDDPAIRQALTLLFKSAGLASESFASGGQLLAADKPNGPACVLLDLSLPDLDGLEVQQRLHRETPGIPVIFLTGYGDVPVAVQALKYGAIDFFQKPDFDRQNLIQTIRQALIDHQEQLEADAAKRSVQALVGSLSHRELEVARLAAAGHANKVIGMELGISERTVETHRGRAMKKLGLRRAADLIKAEKALEETDA
ncbi:MULTISPECIES: response regulator transcription factor [Halomonadaceae]|jgi:FixJ family two-component response regulator|uniref:Response regulator n=1 Tax=Vreelandella halophila TaxID=86177 RepID=A0A9X4YDU8_9GAMM|nr:MULTISPECIES: response regulator [Halomonas]MYL27842.1 response regulator [Halomonas utahensis]MYL74968.1 response regulator [Halomonas sp. 22501_18_FS]